MLQLAEGGMRFDQMAILVHNAERHQPLLEEAFARAAIPAWYTRGTRRPDVCGRAFVALLRCAMEDLSAARFAEYLSLDQMPARDGERHPSSRWERILLKASVINGLQRWERRLQGYANQLEVQEQQGELQATERLGAFALPIIRALAALPREANWDCWIDALADLAGRALDRPAPVHAVLEQLEPMRAMGPVTLGEVLATLEPELASRRNEEDNPRTAQCSWVRLPSLRACALKLSLCPA